MDICQTLAIGPKMTVDFLMKRNVITLIGCSVQMFFIISLAAAEFFLLGVMSYDRYVAICKPLQYPILMRRNIYLSLAVAIWCGASLNALVPAVYVLLQPYCSSNVIRHIFCELPSMLRLSCSDSSVIQRVSFFISTEVLFPTLVTILVSYSCILVTVLRSTGKSHKALGTCLSHLLVVGLFYGAAMFKYLRPMSYRTPFQDDMVSLFCTIVTPMLNPLIYSLRNRDVLDALKKVFRKRTLDQ
ncbi:olfactory receptor 2T27-like [Paroedura picta]|uniref:olfactory receptor 2T27-like n=1 Tax=Paroedura picta TaxID=143630 RepID=UPI004055D9C7